MTPSSVPEEQVKAIQARLDEWLDSYRRACENVVTLGDSHLSATTKERALIRNALRAFALESSASLSRSNEALQAENERLLAALTEIASRAQHDAEFWSLSSAVLSTTDRFESIRDVARAALSGSPGADHGE